MLLSLFRKNKMQAPAVAMPTANDATPRRSLAENIDRIESASRSDASVLAEHYRRKQEHTKSGWCAPTIIKLVLAVIVVLFALIPHNERDRDGKVVAVSLKTRLMRAGWTALISGVWLIVLFMLCKYKHENIAWIVLLFFPAVWFLFVVFGFVRISSEDDSKEKQQSSEPEPETDEDEEEESEDSEGNTSYDYRRAQQKYIVATTAAAGSGGSSGGRPAPQQQQQHPFGMKKKWCGHHGGCNCNGGGDAPFGSNWAEAEAEEAAAAQQAARQQRPLEPMNLDGSSADDAIFVQDDVTSSDSFNNNGGGGGTMIGVKQGGGSGRGRDRGRDGDTSY